jgi:hypothetical protein
MSKRIQRTLVGLVLMLTAFGPATLIAQPASAFPKGDPVYTFKYKVIATATIPKAGITLSPPPGLFQGGIDLATGALKGSIQIPNTTFTQSEAGIGLVTATAAMEQLKPVTGHVNIGTFKVSATSVFNIHILTMYPATPQLPKLPIALPIPIALPPINLVGSSCMTSTPVTVTMSGKANLGGASKFSGTFTIPPFANCGLMTTVVNQEVPGPGNTFSAVATPAK